MTLKKLTINRNQKGFTLIELMIVIAIIGILAAIAIPNYIAYRDKAFCSAAESDAQAIASGLADYFAIPGHTTYPTTVTNATSVDFAPAGKVIDLSGDNTVSLSESNGTYTIAVKDVSTRCPSAYMDGGAPNWNTATNTYTISM